MSAVEPTPQTTEDTENLATFRRPATQAIPAGAMVFDIESGSADAVFTAGPEFVRITGVQVGDGIYVTDDPEKVADLMRRSNKIVGHNIMGFDMIPFSRNHGIDVHELAERRVLWDTMLAEVLINPPDPGTNPERVLSGYGLDHLGETKFGANKSASIRDMAKQFGGYDQIPTNHGPYVRYCAQDVDLTTQLAYTQRSDTLTTNYILREHRVAAMAAQIRTNGFLVDQELLHARIEEGNARRTRLVRDLVERIGLPARFDDAGEVIGMPQRTNAGKAKIVSAFEELGVELPRTPAGAPSLGKLQLAEMAEQYADRPEVAELVEAVQALNGVRTVYDTALHNLHPDGRVHPDILMFQASGRWSTKNPGLTVYGKRGGRHIEREIFIPEPGHVIIAADLSQVDARAIAAWCQDEAYLKLFEDGQEYDSHEQVAIAIWGDPKRRSDAKALGHGYNYGLGLAKLAKAAGSLEVAQRFMDGMASAFPRLAQWKHEIRTEAVARGYVLDNGWGRKLRVQEGREYTQAPALVGQSAARDIMMQGLLRLPKRLLPMLRAQVHDEIVLSVPEDEVDEIERQVVDALSFPWSPFAGTRGHVRTVQIEAGVGKRGRNWGDVYGK